MSAPVPPPPGDDVCLLSTRVDGPKHGWKFDGDDPYIVCSFCDEMRDALSGRVVRVGRGMAVSPDVSPPPADDEPFVPLTAQQLGLCGPLSDDPGVGPDAARHTPPVRVTANVILFKPSGKYYTEEPWRIPAGAIGPYDMKHSVDARRIDGGPVLVDTQEPWGYPHLFPADASVTGDGPEQSGRRSSAAAPAMRYELSCMVCSPSPHFHLSPFESNAARQAWADAHQAATGHEDYRFTDTPVSVGPAEAAEPAPAPRAWAIWNDAGEAGAPEPGYQCIADAIQRLCEESAEVQVQLRPTKAGVTEWIGDQYLRLAQILDRAGLIDWTAFADEAGSVTITPDLAALAAAARNVLAEWSRMHPSGYLAMYPAMDALRAALAATPVEAVLIGTWADPEFRAHQEHKHPVEGCGYCPSEEDR